MALLLCLPAQAKVAESKVLKGVFIDDRGKPEEREKIEETFKRIQESPSVRALEPRRRKLGPVTVNFAMLATSSEPFNAGRSECDLPVPRVLFGETLLENPDYFAETAAHELYGHCLILREARQHGLEMSKVLENEAFSYAIGVVAAMEIGASNDSDARIVPLSISTNTYAAHILCQDSPEHLSLSVEETIDPHETIKARRREMARRRVSTRMYRQVTKLWRWRVEHFVNKHRADPKAFADINKSMDDAERLTYPAQSKIVDVAEPDMINLDEFMDTEKGKEFITEIAAISTNPYAWALHREWEGLQKRFAKLIADLPAADPPAPSTAPVTAQIGWTELDEMSAKDMAEHLDHWDGSPDAGVPFEWRVPWPRQPPPGMPASKVLPGVFIDDRGKPKERARIEAGLKRLQKSAIIQALEPRRRARGRFLIGFTKLDTSTKTFSGANGNTNSSEDPIRININESLYVSTHGFIETLAHELYGHGITSGEADDLDLDLGHTIHGEAHALAVGILAALETGASVNEEPRLDALARGTTAYEAEVLFEDAKERRLELSLTESRDPLAALAARRKELARRRKSVAGRREESLVWRWRIEHFVKVHRMDPKSFEDMRAAVDGTLDQVLPEQSALLDAADPYLKETEAWIKKTKDGRKFAAGMVAASTSTMMRDLEAELVTHGRYIAVLRALAPAPVAEQATTAPAEATQPGVAQVDWAGMDELCNKDRVEHPEHWKGVREPSEKAPPWFAP